MLEAATFVNQIFKNFAWNDGVKSFFCIVGTSWMGWSRVEWYWHMGISYLTSLNTQLFKNIAYVGSFGHILFNLIFNVNSNLAEFSANCEVGRIASQTWLQLFLAHLAQYFLPIGGGLIFLVITTVICFWWHIFFCCCNRRPNAKPKKAKTYA